MAQPPQSRAFATPGSADEQTCFALQFPEAQSLPSVHAAPSGASATQTRFVSQLAVGMQRIPLPQAAPGCAAGWQTMLVLQKDADPHNVIVSSQCWPSATTT